MEDISNTCFYRVEVRVRGLPSPSAPQLRRCCGAGLVDV